MSRAGVRSRYLWLCGLLSVAGLAACSSTPAGTNGPASHAGATTSAGGISSSARPGTSVASRLPPAAGSTTSTTTSAAAAPLVEPATQLLVNADGHLRIVRADGTGGHIAVPGVDALGATNEVVAGDWSPDGGRISFTRVDRKTDPFRATLWVAKSDGSGARQVFACTDPCRRAGLGAWSPGGDRLTYVLTEIDPVTKAPTRNAVEVVTLATGQRRVVVESKDPLVQYSFPRWSPDARRIVVQIDHAPAQSQGGNSDVALTPAVGVLDLALPRNQSPRVLAPKLAATYPDWSWPSDTILFSTNGPDAGSPDDAERNLWTVRPDGSGLRQVTRFAAPAAAFHPTWTADGTIAFVHCVTMPACFLAYASADGSVVQTPQAVRGTWPRVQPST